MFEIQLYYDLLNINVSSSSAGWIKRFMDRKQPMGRSLALWTGEGAFSTTVYSSSTTCSYFLLGFFCLNMKVDCSHSSALSSTCRFLPQSLTLPCSRLKSQVTGQTESAPVDSPAQVTCVFC